MQRALTVLVSLWSGVLAAIALIVAPTLFATLDRATAGNVAGVIFAQEARASLAMVVVAFLLERRLAELRADSGTGSRLSGELVMLLAVLFCTVLGHFALQPLVQQARQGAGPLSFGAAHGLSTVLFVAKALLLLGTAWLATGRLRLGPHAGVTAADVSPSPASSSR